MNVAEFFVAYAGLFVDFDGADGPQCVDLAQYYNRDVIGGPPLTGNACDIWATYPRAFYSEVTNTPANFPALGDVVIWSGVLNGGFGHIAIASSGDGSSFISFDQNWPEGSACHFQQHDYSYVLGWLVPIASQRTGVIHQACALKANPDHGPVVVAMLAAGTVVDPTGQSTPHWVQVVANGKTGWVLKENVL